MGRSRRQLGALAAAPAGAPAAAAQDAGRLARISVKAWGRLGGAQCPSSRRWAAKPELAAIGSRCAPERGIVRPGQNLSRAPTASAPPISDS